MMSNSNQPTLLAFEERFSVTEQSYESGFSVENIIDFEQAAADVLTAIIALEQMSYEHVDPDSKGITSDILRLEQKLDFITELLAKSLQSQQEKLEKNNIKMSAENVFWNSSISINKGGFCLLSIYLSDKYPTPLQLPVEVISSEVNKLGLTEHCGRILLSDEKVIDDLTRMVFLYHRRQIARNRT